MGWKGVVRSIGAAARAAERDARRRQRELALRHAQYRKMQAREQAAYDVELHHNRIDLIRSVHKECGDGIDWPQTVALPPPIRPEPPRQRERHAREAEQRYRPGLVDRLFKSERKQRERLASAVLAASEADARDHQHDVARWTQEHAQWQETNALGADVLAGKAKARLAVIERANPFSEISSLGSHLSFSVEDGGALRVDVRVHGSEIVPEESRSLLQSGRVSVKKMSKSAFNELHQDYVCSCVLRVAREIFAILPDDLVIVNALDELLDTTTGHLVESTILSVAISRSTLDGLNLDAIDPSDSLRNFVHRMKFGKSNGFEAVAGLEPGAFSA